MHISDIQGNNSIVTKCSKMTEEGHKYRHGMNGNVDGGSCAVKEEPFTEEGYRYRHGMNGNNDRSLSIIKEESVVVKEEPIRNTYSQGGRLKFFKDGKFILELERAREGERVSWVSVPRKTFWPPQGVASSTTPTYRQESSTSLSVSDDNSSIQSSPWQRDHFWKQTTPRRNLSKQMVFYYKRPKTQCCKPSRKRRRPYDHSPENSFKVLTSDCRTNNKQDSVCNSNSKPKVFKTRPSLQTVVQMLLDKTLSSTPPRIDIVVSPRKRILRELEKDKIPIEDSCQKRSRNKVLPAVSVTASGTVVKVGSPVQVNGTTTEELRTSRNSSYSITSLLSEDRNSRRSPSDSPSHFPILQNQYCSTTMDERWCSESVDRLRSIELSHTDKRALPFPHFSYMSSYMCPYPLYYTHGTYMRGGYMAPPIYSGPPITLPVRPEAPSCSWTMEPSLNTTEHRDDNITDMPLNLSKHAS